MAMAPSQLFTGGVSAFGGDLADETASLGADAGAGPLAPFLLAAQAAQFGLSQIPGFGGGQAPMPSIQSSQTNPRVTTTNTNSPFGIQIDPTMIGGSGGNASASSSGGFGFPGISIAKGGAGGGNNLMITADPTYNLSTNLPGLSALPTQPNLIQGGVGMNTMIRPNMVPMPAPGSPLGNIMNTPFPIAAGGVSPMFAGMTAMQQQQQYPGGQQIIPGTASQTGGYDQPQQQGPMPGFPPPQAPMGAGTILSQLANRFGPGYNMVGVQGDQGAPMPGLRPYTPPQPQGMQATANALPTGPQPAPQRKQGVIKGGASEATKPDSLLDQTRAQIAKEMQEMASKPMELTSQALKDYQKRLDDAQRADDIATAPMQARHEAGQRGTDDALTKAKDYSDPTKTALTDDHKKLVDQVYNSLSPKDKKLYDLRNGTKQNDKLATAMSWLHTFARAGVAGFQPFSSPALYEDDWATQNKNARADKVYNHVQAQADKLLTQQLDQAKEAATLAAQQTTSSGADLGRAQTRYNEEQNQAEKQTIGVAGAGGTAISHTANILDHLSNMMHQATAEDDAQQNLVMRGQGLKIAQQNAAADESRASSAASNASVTANKFRWEQAKDVRDYPGVRFARAQKENLDLTNQIASLKNQVAPAEFTAPLKIKLLQNEGQLPAQYSTAQLQQVFERVKAGIVKAEALAARGIDIKTLQDAYK